MPKKKRIFVFLAMPFAVFLWFIGWALYWVGARKEKLKPEPVKKKESVTLTVLLPEEKIEA
jgi:hypothetical protein